jgi:hypothetical protein
MPVGGGAIQTVVAGPVGSNFIAVGATSVYYVSASSTLYSAPKAGGGTPTLLSTTGALAYGASALGSTLYWLELNNGTCTLKTTPLDGGSISTLTSFPFNQGSNLASFAVTDTTVFLTNRTETLLSFPLAGLPDGGTPTTVPGMIGPCWPLLSDTSAVYCDTGSSMLSITSTGASSTMGPVVTGSMTDLGSAASDETFVYWLDTTTVGTVMKAPKAGGAMTTIAHDTGPAAIAVDANSIYWSDQAGNIIRLPK